MTRYVSGGYDRPPVAVWECPACGRRVRTGGHVVNLRCDCRAAGGAGPAVWMKLVEGPPQPPRRE